MKIDKVQLVTATGLLGAFASFWRWHSPPAKKLTPKEIDEYLAIIAKLPLPGDEIDKIVGQLRPWAEADDGKPTYMLNLIRYFPELHRFPGAPEFDGTPEEANAYYEKSITRLWLGTRRTRWSAGPHRARTSSRRSRNRTRGAPPKWSAIRADAPSSSCCQIPHTARSSRTSSWHWRSTSYPFQVTR